MSTSPSLPKPAASAPVLASSAIRRRPEVKMMRGALLPSPRQYATPRREGAAPLTGYRQISLPVSDSSATTRFAAGRYITRFTTMGVASEFTPPGPPPSGRDGGRRRVALQTIGPDLGQRRDVLRIDFDERRIGANVRRAWCDVPVRRGAAGATTAFASR